MGRDKMGPTHDRPHIIGTACAVDQQGAAIARLIALDCGAGVVPDNPAAFSPSMEVDVPPFSMIANH